MKHINKMRIDLKNDHLLDIFEDNRFVEVGTLKEQVMKNLLKRKTIPIEDIIDFNILSVGIGSQDFNNLSINNYLPIINFLNFNEEDQEKKIFLTEGIFYYIKDNKKEIFAPIILIPVHLSREDNQIYLKMISVPVANPVLISYLNANDIVIPEEKLDSIYSFNKYLNAFIKNNLEVRLENYLTFATVNESPFSINHEKYSLENKYRDQLDNYYYLNTNTEIYNISHLNYYQRLAVLKAQSGNSFAINGVSGTGKTTTLLNIAAAAAFNNKKVLYVSNKKSTLTQVEEKLKKLKLGYLVDNATFLNPRKLPISEEFNEYIDDHIIKEELVSLYKDVNNYENHLAGRIHNHRYLEVITELMKHYELTDDFKCDNLSNLYKVEFEEIVISLKNIEIAMESINFKKSLFINIPINNGIKYPNQVLTLLFQLHRLFSDLFEYKNELKNKFGVNDIENYARFKNYITDISNLNVQDIPSEWSDVNNFKSALNVYGELKTLVYAYQEYQLYINWDYIDVDKIDIDKMINTILGGYFTEEDNYKIDRIIISNKPLINRTNDALQNYRQLIKNSGIISKILDWDFDLNDNSHITEILNLVHFLNNSIYHRSWINEDNHQEILADLISISKSLNKYILLSKRYFKYFNNKKDIKVNIKYLEKIKKSNKIPKRFNNVDLDELLSDINDYQEIKDLISDLNIRHKNITGFEYSLSYDTTLDFKKFVEYIESISDSVIRNKICSFLEKATDEDMDNYLQDLNKFEQNHRVFTENYEYISELVPGIKCEVLLDKNRFLSRFSKYLNKVFKTNLEMIRFLKDSKRRVSLDVYIKLRNQLKQINRIKKELSEKTDFKKYFGKLFEFEKTNISRINLIVNSYEKYVNCFTNDQEVLSSLKDENYFQIKDLINSANNVVFEINDNFKVYNKIFKDGIGSYYYDDFNSIIKRLYELMMAKDELKIYLDVTKSLQVIDNYKLFILSKYIIDSNSTKLVDNFKHKYYHGLNDLYFNPAICNNKELTSKLNRIMDLEEALVNYNRYIIKSKKYTSFFTEQEIRRSNKPICLTNTTFLNYELDYQDYDLVLIDDAHLSNSNEYNLAMNIPQVIIAGNGYMKNALLSNLLMRIRSKNTMNLNYRFHATPLVMLDRTDEVEGPFPTDLKDNIGFEVISKDIHLLIAELFNKNKEIKINCFIPSISEEVELINKIVKELLKNNFSSVEILNLLLNNINIVDLFSGHLLNADYNIIDIDLYYNDDKDFSEIKTFLSLTMINDKLYIIDKNNRLVEDENNQLVKSINSLIGHKIVFSHEDNIIFKNLKKALKKHDIITHGRLSEYSLILEAKGKYFPVIIFADPFSNNINLLDIYREYYAHVDKKMPVLFLWIVDLLDNFEQTVDYILKEIAK